MFTKTILKKRTLNASIFDKTAIGLSALCAIHCLFTPILLVALPSIGAFPLENEAFHMWMVFIVIPLSILTLTLGCKKHNQNRILAIGLIGLLLISVAIMLPHEMLGEWGEKVLSLLGAATVAFSHIQNSRACQSQSDCSCAT